MSLASPPRWGKRGIGPYIRFIKNLKVINRIWKTAWNVDKKIRIGLIVAALAASAIILTSPSEPIPLPEPKSTSHGTDSVVVLAEKLKKPRSIAFADDRIFVTEKSGKLRVIQDGTLLEEPVASLRVADVFDGGLLGVAVHPNFSENNFLYVFYTYTEDGKLWNKVLQITESNNKLQDAKTILDKIPGSQFSNGGIIKFGPDGKLYIATGTVSDSSHLPQDKDSLVGKILRINDDGSIPNDNPFENSPVYSIGFRNPQGMTWDDSGNLYVSELGPSKNDEINLVISGGNYGWPNQQCSGDANAIDAKICYDPSIEPGGILIYYGEKLPLGDNLVMSTLRGSNLFSIDLEQPKSQKSILSGVGRIRDVAQGPDGNLYIITSNTDGKGFPTSSDDKLLRIVK